MVRHIAQFVLRFVYCECHSPHQGEDLCRLCKYYLVVFPLGICDLIRAFSYPGWKFHLSPFGLHLGDHRSGGTSTTARVEFHLGVTSAISNARFGCARRNPPPSHTKFINITRKGKKNKRWRPARSVLLAPKSCRPVSIPQVARDDAELWLLEPDMSWWT